MKPLFFPYTYVMEATLEAYRCFFSGITVLQSTMDGMPEPMREWAAQGLLDVRLPDPEVSRMFEKVLAETENWIRNHRDGVASFLKSYQDDVPFFGPSSVSQIRQDIRMAGRSVPPHAQQRERLLRARIFLHIAQNFDAQNQWLSHQLQQHEAMERNLYRELKGHANSEERATMPAQPTENEDTFQYMILDRLKAWSRVMLSHGPPQGPFLTTRASVLTWIQEHMLDTEMLIPAATIPLILKDGESADKERQELADYCKKLTDTPLKRLKDSGLLNEYSDETTDALCLKLYLLPGMTPQILFSRCAGGKFSADRGAGLEVNTLMGCIHKAAD
jgi:hypothetical protein